VTRLLTVAHGTRHSTGNEVARAVTVAAGRKLGIPASTSYVELCAPSFADEVRPDDIVVPLLLSIGHHVRHDLPSQAGRTFVGPPLGPHPLLARTQAQRLLEAGATRGAPVVMVAAGSTDPLATRDQRAAADLLSAEWGGSVDVATLSGHGPRIEDVVGPGDAVSLYLLSPGFFSRRAREEALAAGASVVADVLGAHDLVADLVVERATGWRQRTPRPTR
jgi:sirohydrochlorin ferrochelatase